jgi:hypothetical protein
LTVPTSTLRYGASSGLPRASAARCAVTRHIKMRSHTSHQRGGRCDGGVCAY